MKYACVVTESRVIRYFSSLSAELIYTRTDPLIVLDDRHGGRSRRKGINMNPTVAKTSCKNTVSTCPRG